MNSKTSTISNEQLKSLGKPTSFHQFGSHCSSSHFKDEVMVFNIALCGGWPNNWWHTTGCQHTGFSSCDAFVAGAKPSAFKEAYFEINYLKVFKYSGSVTDGVSSAHIGSGTGTGTGFDKWERNPVHS